MRQRKHLQSLPEISTDTYNTGLRDFHIRKQTPGAEREFIAALLNDLEELSPDLSRAVRSMQSGPLARRNLRTLLFVLYCFDRQIGNKIFNKLLEE